jgi:hypothetical protein
MSNGKPLECRLSGEEVVAASSDFEGGGSK